MSPQLSEPAVDARIDSTTSTPTLHLRGAVAVRRAAAVRRAVREFLDTTSRSQRVVVDLTAVEELDAAGLAAVTSPVLQAGRTGRTVAIVPPIAAAPRRLADLVGILPIHAG